MAGEKESHLVLQRIHVWDPIDRVYLPEDVGVDRYSSGGIEAALLRVSPPDQAALQLHGANMPKMGISVC